MAFYWKLKMDAPKQWDPGEPDGVDADSESAAGAMGFLDHLEDLRWTIAKCLLAFIVSALAVGVLIFKVSSLLNWPLRFALGEQTLEQGLVTTSPFGVFVVIMQIIFFGGFALSLPAMIYFVARFVAPGLTERELRILRPVCLAVFGLFVTGVLFSFFILTPAALVASVHFNALFDFRLYWSADRYYGMVTKMVLGVGMLFEFPLVLLILVYIGILDAEKLRTFRPYSVIVILCLSAFLTPTTDPLTFLLLAFPLYGLYELSIWISSTMQRRHGSDLT